MIKLIVKKELEGLMYDLNRGVEAGQDKDSLLNMVAQKISGVLDRSKIGYIKTIWEDK